jgi:phenylpropionate dioxygenase-like ring-hydroxylating dioxygenase large terminal subunit
MKYLRNCWYVAAWSTEVAQGKPYKMSILNEPLVIWRGASGQLNALEDRCVHRMAPLSMGRCEGDDLRCMYHGLLYGADGRVKEIPGQAKVPPQACVRRYAVIDKHSWIWVWMGDAATADPKLIPEAVGLEDPNWILGHGHLDYQAEARLINDNLLDFSHLSFVHAKSFQPGEDFAQQQPTIERLDRGLRFSRWVPGAMRRLSNTPDQRFDNWQSYDFVLPGVLLMWSGSFSEGAAAENQMRKPDYEKAVGNVAFTSQAVTPMTAKTSRYFFSWGPHCRHGDEKMRDAMMGLAAMAFGEDKAIIEAQQLVIDATAEPRIMPTAHDRGVTLFNQMIERMLQQEAPCRAAS